VQEDLEIEASLDHIAKKSTMQCIGLLYRNYYLTIVRFCCFVFTKEDSVSLTVHLTSAVQNL
jgi:hypothetical protein